jgi:hypothetical protein
MAKAWPCIMALAILLSLTLPYQSVMGAPKARGGDDSGSDSSDVELEPRPPKGAHIKSPRRRKAELSHRDMEHYRGQAMRLEIYPQAFVEAPPNAKHEYHYYREPCTINRKALLYHNALIGANLIKAIPPMIAKLVDSTPLWIDNAIGKSHDQLKNCALNFLLKLEDGMHRQSINQAWDEEEIGDIKPHNEYALMHSFGRITRVLGSLEIVADSFVPLCMSLIPVFACPLMYFNLHKKGYFNLDFGKGEMVPRKGKKEKVLRVIVGAHVIVCWLFHGPPPSKGLEVGHLCGHPNCLNPMHLHWCSKHTNALVRKWHKQNGRGNLYINANNAQVAG